MSRDDLLVLSAGQKRRPESEPLDALGDLPNRRALFRGFLPHGTRSEMGSHTAAAFFVSVSANSTNSTNSFEILFPGEEDIRIGIIIQSKTPVLPAGLDRRWTMI